MVGTVGEVKGADHRTFEGQRNGIVLSFISRRSCICREGTVRLDWISLLVVAVVAVVAVVVVDAIVVVVVVAVVVVVVVQVSVIVVLVLK